MFEGVAAAFRAFIDAFALDINYMLYVLVSTGIVTLFAVEQTVPPVLVIDLLENLSIFLSFNLTVALFWIKSPYFVVTYTIFQFIEQLFFLKLNFFYLIFLIENIILSFFMGIF